VRLDAVGQAGICQVQRVRLAGRRHRPRRKANEHSGAIASFDNGVRARAQLNGDRLVVDVGSYTLTCQRHGPEADVAAPEGTGG
jgi:hypothetical protein